MSAPFRFPIQVVEAGGISAWLFEDHSVPVVSLAWGWPGGSPLDPPLADGRVAVGATRLGAALLTEGAGDLGATAFADALRDEAIALSFSCDRDGFDGSFRALSPALPEAVRLARLAMTAPRFDAEAVARVRARAMAGARQSLETPSGQAARAFWAEGFPGHPAGRPVGGTAEDIAALSVDQIREALSRQVRRGGLLVAAAGAIDARALAALLPALFDGLPAGAPPETPPLPPLRRFGPEVIQVPAPQSTVIFGQEGIAVDDPDWEAAQVVMRVLAGGGFASRLMQAVRVQRGLAYGIGAGMQVLYGRALLVGQVATANPRVGETLSVTREEWARMAKEGPNADELADAVAYLTGSLPLQLAETRPIAATLLAQRRNGRDPEWLSGRSARLEAVTLDKARAVAARLLKPDALSVVVAGQPEGI
ncbi:insulinase family protein [Roseomonas sp. NAR14]|uniref:Insulinase family protein n=1 Tax=Roseomonas acroporae TaxID=2937791 RepID=A0A9X1Y622_9PROT|nr:pitrilysin family protein [Roseomonas acroporae]MCK8784176.1 insulinase family protein [Roseomonas acroporae]